MSSLDLPTVLHCTVYSSNYSNTRSIMFPEDAPAKASEGLVWPNPGLSVGLHEQSKGLSTDFLRTTHSDTMGSGAESSICSELEGFAGLESQTIRRNGDLGQLAAACFNI